VPLQQDLSAIGRVLAACREKRDANNSESQGQNRTEPLNTLQREEFGQGFRFGNHSNQYKSEINEN
jgi:collagenase-like PrtC family protease